MFILLGSGNVTLRELSFYILQIKDIVKLNFDNNKESDLECYSKDMKELSLQTFQKVLDKVIN